MFLKSREGNIFNRCDALEPRWQVVLLQHEYLMDCAVLKLKWENLMNLIGAD